MTSLVVGDSAKKVTYLWSLWKQSLEREMVYDSLIGRFGLETRFGGSCCSSLSFSVSSFFSFTRYAYTAGILSLTARLSSSSIQLFEGFIHLYTTHL